MICQGKTLTGAPCQRHAIAGSDYCRYHQQADQTEKYARDMPTDRLAIYREALADRNLYSHQAEIALIDERIQSRAAELRQPVDVPALLRSVKALTNALADEELSLVTIALVDDVRQAINQVPDTDAIDKALIELTSQKMKLVKADDARNEQQRVKIQAELIIELINKCMMPVVLKHFDPKAARAFYVEVVDVFGRNVGEQTIEGELIYDN